MKKFLAMLLALVMALSLVACGEKKDDTQGNGDGDATAAKVKVGFITLHDENSTYDKNFIDAAKEACANLGWSRMRITSSRPTWARPSSAPRSPLIWWMPAATSSLPTALVMSLT